VDSSSRDRPVEGELVEYAERMIDSGHAFECNPMSELLDVQEKNNEVDLDIIRGQPIRSIR
jgi:hypothetical protein